MKIHFKTDGGFAYIPALNKPLEIDSNELPEEEANYLKQLVSEAGFYELPSQSLESVRGADMIKYLIQIDDKDRKHWVQVSDGNMGDGLQKLVRYLSNKRKDQQKEK